MNATTLPATGLIAVLLWVGTVGCASFQTVDYSPKPRQSERPAEDFIRLVMMAKKWQPTEVEVKQTFATLWYVGSDIPTGETSVTIPFDEVDRIRVGQLRGHELVRVTDADGEKLYEYVAHDREKAKEFADAMAALVQNQGDIETESTTSEDS